MYNIRPTTKFQKDLKRVKKRGFDISLLTDIIKKLASGELLPEKNRDHQLSGDYAGCRECHITPDWVTDLRSGRGRADFYISPGRDRIAIYFESKLNTASKRVDFCQSSFFLTQTKFLDYILTTRRKLL